MPELTSPSPTAEWPLVGRDDDLRRALRLLLDNRRSVVIAGHTGVGKTRLAQEALKVCADQGRAVVTVSATRASRDIPLGAFAAHLPAQEQTRGTVDDRASLLRRCSANLLDGAGDRPLVVGVDDAHLLDDTSATLLLQLCEAPSAVVVATIRSSEPCPDAVLALWKGGHAERIELQELGEDQVRAALASVLGGNVDEAAVAEMTARSRGNMLFLRELVVGALAGGILRDDGGIWRLLGELHPTDRLVELVEARLAGLSGEERELLEIVALGEPLPPKDLDQLAGLDTAERLEREGLLRASTTSGRLLMKLGHPIYGDVLRERIPKLRARSVARALADAAQSAGLGGPEDLLRVAEWRLLADGGAAPDLLHAAAVEARWRYDFALATKYGRAAIANGAGFTTSLLLAQLSCLQGLTDQAEEELDQLADHAPTPADRGAVALARLDNRVIYVGDVREGLRIADEAMSALPAGDLRDEIAARRVALLLAEGGPGAAAAAAAPLLTGATGRALAWVCMPAAFSLARTGRSDEALRASRLGRETQSRLSAPTNWYPFMHAFYEAEALEHAGRFAEARTLSDAGYREGVENRSVEQQALFNWQRGRAVADRGEVTEAIRQLSTAISIYEQLGRPQFVDFCLTYLAEALAVGGRADDAQQALERRVQLDTGGTHFMGVDPLCARGWALASASRLREAREVFLAAADDGERIEDRVGALAALHAVGRLGSASDVATRAAGLAAHVQGRLPAARAAHLRALATHDARGLSAVSSEFEQMGAWLLAAESAADCARAHQRAGEPRAAIAADRRACELARRCDGAATPALRGLDTGRPALTDAEWQTSSLAASGLTNREIAARQVVSVRTVENRLQQVYGKLGISSRTELAGALPQSLGRASPLPS